MKHRAAHKKIADRAAAAVFALLAGMTVLCGFALSPVRALESSNVRIEFFPSYTVNPVNTAHSTIGIDFTNHGDIPTVLTTYDLQVGRAKPSNIVVTHGSETLSAQLIGSPEHAVRIDLGEELLRVDDTFHIDVKFDIAQFMTEVGRGRDVEIPLTGGSEGQSLTGLRFSYPESFGGVNYGSSAFTQKSENGYTTLLFDDVASEERLFLSIGDEKAYSLFIERTLENDSEVYVKRSVSIPPDTDSQQLVLTTISPFPSDVSRSLDGNYTLIYDIGPGETVWVRVQGVIIRSHGLVPTYFMSSEKMSHYLDTSPDLWKITDDGVLSVVEAAAEKSLTEKIDWIYGYTIEELILNEGFRSLHEDEMRKGAQLALKTYKGASVEDYADVFVALARQLDIPSRVVAGYIFPYTVGEKYLGTFHVWPQYWTEETGWISVDPAYEAYTGMELKENVGLNRVYMSLSYDSGDYELYSDTTDEVTYTNAETQPRVELTAELEGLSDIVAGSGGKGTLVLSNNGNCIMHSISLVVDEISAVEVTLDENSLRTAILPGETIQVPFTIEPPEWYVEGAKQLSFTLVAESSSGTERKVVEQVVVIKPLWWVEPVSWLLTLIAFLITGALVLGGYKVFRWYRNRKKPPVSFEEEILS
jgi:transglutaminase-like putative cysteine protease